MDLHCSTYLHTKMKKIINKQDSLKFRELFLKSIESFKGTEKLYLSLSGGIDSAIIFFSLIEKKIDFKCFTFRTENYISNDFKSSKRLCELFNIEFIPIILKTDIDSLYKGAEDVVRITSKRKKTIIECCYPYLTVCKVIPQQSTILTGLSADDLYCNQRKLSVMLSESGEESILKYRKSYTDDENFSNFNIIKVGKTKNIVQVFKMKWKLKNVSSITYCCLVISECSITSVRHFILNTMLADALFCRQILNYENNLEAS